MGPGRSVGPGQIIRPGGEESKHRVGFGSIYYTSSDCTGQTHVRERIAFLGG